ncbi:hypothetical protein G7Y89_g2713 [Cudoniella acicularis]|uniref:Uncharacterized protein n=1 Tax=Cudoniella acicularis TaxID=354080 RepID=A0A8H4W5V9_9HELO|nr:hypothetical protein G7Y89_g2713 [Cudoniella acicularis]
METHYPPPHLANERQQQPPAISQLLAQPSSPPPNFCRCPICLFQYHIMVRYGDATVYMTTPKTAPYVPSAHWLASQQQRIPDSDPESEDDSYNSDDEWVIRGETVLARAQRRAKEHWACVRISLPLPSTEHLD